MGGSESEQKQESWEVVKSEKPEQDTPVMQVRAVTSFIVLGKDKSTWKAIIVKAAEFISTVASGLVLQNYIVQTLRLVTNPFGEYLDLSSEQAALADMERLKEILSGSDMPKVRIRFAIGAATSKEDLLMVPALITKYGDLANVCMNIGADELGVPDQDLCAAAATCVRTLAENTPNGEGNFNFTANFNCAPLIPYFPAGYNTDKSVFCLGLEYPDLLIQVLQNQPKPVNLDTAYTAMQTAVQAHVDTVVGIAKRVSKQFNVPFAGIDSSPAPRKDIHSMVEVFQLLGTEFGSAGTLKCCQYLTRLFKSVKGVDLVGFSGLMLTCLEDAGMAASAAKKAYNITMLNAYSAVCGIGLDCVPVPGDIPKEVITALMSDCGSMAFRLNKPLTVRLFPCPGLKAGDMTQFDSPDLCNCTVFEAQ